MFFHLNTYRCAIDIGALKNHPMKYEILHLKLEIQLEIPDRINEVELDYK